MRTTHHTTLLSTRTVSIIRSRLIAPQESDGSIDRVLLCCSAMTERDYVLGTHDAEIERLGLQHRIWREYALRAWRRAGIGAGDTVIDLGAGPGYASVDLAELVGHTGSVIAIERSARFAEAARAAASSRQLAQLVVREEDLLTCDLGTATADASWCRWVLSFTTDPTAVVATLRRALRQGAVAVFHEYVDYAAWRLAPRSDAHEHFVAQVMKSWRADGGEPNIGLALPAMLAANGFAIESLVPIQHTTRPHEYFWQWPRAFVSTGSERLVSLGYLTREQAEATAAAVRAAESQPGAFMATPVVLEVIARAH